jgi:hypothetical protein
MDLTEIRLYSMGWSDVAQNKDQCMNEPSGPINNVKFVSSCTTVNLSQGFRSKDLVG